MSGSVWGETETRYFYELTPERILDAVESAAGVRCTGRAMALNSMENRVYEIELDLDDVPKDPTGRFLIAKFYRPGRWSEAQILDEHQYLAELAELEIPVVAPLKLQDGSTLATLKGEGQGMGLYFALFPKVSGRSPDELTDDQLAQVGRLLGRMHNVGASRVAPHRLHLTPESYGMANLRHLIDARILPDEIRASYQSTVEQICQITEPWFKATTPHRIHGDCHRGNLLVGRAGMFFVDFDDMVTGPATQDLWLLIPGRDDDSQRQLEAMLEGYETMRPFNRHELRLIEPLRALRFVHFSAWIGRRFTDPAFPRAFPHFGTQKYWQEQLQDLREQLALIQDLL